MRRDPRDHRGMLGPMRPGRPMVRRGDIRPLILVMLREQPMHGYQLIQELEARSSGRWRPSAGSIYPTLQLLEDEGLVRGEELDGRRTYTLTEAGRTAAEADPFGRHPMFGQPATGESVDLRRLGRDVIGAAMEVMRTGSPDAQLRARDLLVETRRGLYRLLADDDAIAPAADPEAVAQAAGPEA